MAILDMLSLARCKAQVPAFTHQPQSITALWRYTAVTFAYMYVNRSTDRLID